MEISGKIKSIHEPRLYSNKYIKREFVLQTSEQFPQLLIMELIGEKCKILDEVFVGEEVCVDFRLIGHEWTNPQGEKVYFNFIRANKIRALKEYLQNFEKLNLSHFLMDINKNQN